MGEENNCKNSEHITKYDLNNLDKRLSAEIRENRKKIEENSDMISRLEAVYKSLEGLPLTITNLDKTITVIGANLDSMDRNLKDVKESVTTQAEAIREIRKENKQQNESIDKIDNKSKVDWAEFITNNFWKIFAVCGILYIAAKVFIEGGA